MIRINKLSLLLFSIALASINLSSFAQFTGGGRAGVNFSNLRGSVVNNKMVVGYNIGGFANYNLEELISGDIGKILSIQAELGLETKGATIDYPIFTLNGDSWTDTIKSVKENLSYLQIPVLAKFTFGDPKEINYFGEAGFYAAGLSGVTVDGEKRYEDDDDAATDRRKYRDDYSGFDFGIVVGGGASIPFGGRKSPWRAYGNLRYTLGLSNIGEAREGTPLVYVPYLSNVKTSTISLLFGVSYKF
jgi:hypothetical protein